MIVECLGPHIVSNGPTTQSSLVPFLSFEGLLLNHLDKIAQIEPVTQIKSFSEPPRLQGTYELKNNSTSLMGEDTEVLTNQTYELREKVLSSNSLSNETNSLNKKSPVISENLANVVLGQDPSFQASIPDNIPNVAHIAPEKNEQQNDITRDVYVFTRKEISNGIKNGIVLIDKQSLSYIDSLNTSIFENSTDVLINQDVNFQTSTKDNMSNLPSMIPKRTEKQPDINQAVYPFSDKEIKNGVKNEVGLAKDSLVLNSDLQRNIAILDSSVRVLIGHDVNFRTSVTDEIQNVLYGLSETNERDQRIVQVVNSSIKKGFKNEGEGEIALGEYEPVFNGMLSNTGFERGDTKFQINDLTRPDSSIQSYRNTYDGLGFQDELPSSYRGGEPGVKESRPDNLSRTDNSGLEKLDKEGLNKKPEGVFEKQGAGLDDVISSDIDLSRSDRGIDGNSVRRSFITNERKGFTANGNDFNGSLGVKDLGGRAQIEPKEGESVKNYKEFYEVESFGDSKYKDSQTQVEIENENISNITHILSESKFSKNDDEQKSNYSQNELKVNERDSLKGYKGEISLNYDRSDAGGPQSDRESLTEYKHNTQRDQFVLRESDTEKIAINEEVKVGSAFHDKEVFFEVGQDSQIPKVEGTYRNPEPDAPKHLESNAPKLLEVIKEIVSTNEGKRSMLQVTIQPEDMGTLKVVVRGGRQDLTVQILTSRGEVKQLVEGSLQELKNGLMEMGYDVQEMFVDLDQGQDAHSDRQDLPKKGFYFMPVGSSYGKEEILSYVPFEITQGLSLFA